MFKKVIELTKILLKKYYLYFITLLIYALLFFCTFMALKNIKTNEPEQLSTLYAVAAGLNDIGQCQVDNLNGLVEIDAGPGYTVGIKEDGSVVVTGYNKHGRNGVWDVSDWSEIVAVSAGDHHIIGLRSDGTAVSTGINIYGECKVGDWNDIVSVSTKSSHTVGLKSDGTVIAVGKNEDGQCNVSEWKDIVAVSAGEGFTVGLKADGSVIAAGNNDNARCDVSKWSDIIAIKADFYRTVGIRSDGSVVATGINDKGQNDVSGWHDIVALALGENHTVGLKSDGTVVATGSNQYGQCNISEWSKVSKVTAGYEFTVALSETELESKYINIPIKEADELTGEKNENETKENTPEELSPEEIYLMENWDIFNIDGSTSMIPLHKALSELFSSDPSKVIKHSKTVESFDKFIKGENDILFGVTYSDELLNKARRSGAEVKSLEITKEGFVFLVNSSNPVKSLTVEQIKGIYSGKYTNWKEVGGDDAPIRAYQRNDDSGSQIRMKKFMGELKLIEKTYVSEQMGELILAIAGFDNDYYNDNDVGSKYAIGYNMYTFTAKQYANSQVRMLEVDGVLPTDQTIFDESYPIIIYN